MKLRHSIPTGSTDIGIFGRLLQNNKGKMSPKLARYVLTLGFPDEDQQRMTDLATRNQQGGLSAEEKAELFKYVKAGHLLALLHSEARMALKKKVC